MENLSSGYPELDKAFITMRKDLREALEICNEFAEKYPENPKLHLTRIHAYERLQDWQRAFHVANQYVAFRPDHPLPLRKRAEAALPLGLYDQAISDMKQAMLLDEDQFMGSLPYRLMAACYAYKASPSQAIVNANEAQRIDGDHYFPPISCIPGGTIPEFRAYLDRVLGR